MTGIIWKNYSDSEKYISCYRDSTLLFDLDWESLGFNINTCININRNKKLKLVKLSKDYVSKIKSCIDSNEIASVKITLQEFIKNTMNIINEKYKISYPLYFYCTKSPCPTGVEVGLYEDLGISKSGYDIEGIVLAGFIHEDVLNLNGVKESVEEMLSEMYNIITKD